MRPLHLPRIEALDLVTCPGWHTWRAADGTITCHWVIEVIEVRLVNEVDMTFAVVRPPGPWPWAVDVLLDATFPIRNAARRWAQRQLDRHGIRCRCGLPVDQRDAMPAHDAYECVGCRRQITGLRIAAAYGRPVRAVLFGL